MSLYLAGKSASRAEIFLSDEKSDESICLKFFVKNGFKWSELLKVLKKIFDIHTWSQQQVCE